MHDVFISYSSPDREAARVVAHRISQAGFSVFFDMEAIVAGELWDDRIAKELRSARAVIALLSSESRRSSWVGDELQEAIDRKKLVIPVLLDQGAKENWLWPLLARRQRIELDLRSPHAEAQLEQLVHVLSSVEQRPAALAMTPSVTRVAASRSSFWKTVAIALASAALGALLAWLLWH